MGMGTHRCRQTGVPQDAARIVAGEMTKWVETGDPYVAAYVRYLRSVAAGKSRPRRSDAAARWAAISAAHDFARRDDPKLWELKSRILADQSVDAIASRFDLSLDALAWFESLFFAVRCRLGMSMWVANRVVGVGLWRGFHDDELDRIWMVHAYHGGVHAVDRFVESFYRVWQPGEPATASVYLRDDASIDLDIQVAVACRVLPRTPEAEPICMQMHSWLHEADRVADVDRGAFLRERARGYLVRCAEPISPAARCPNHEAGRNRARTIRR